MLRSEAMLDRGMIYWDIRLSEHNPTLEFRVCDVARTPEEAALAAALVRALVATALDDLAAGAAPLALPHEVLRANLWRAARDGLAGCCLHPVSGELAPVLMQLRQLVDNLTPVLSEIGDLDFVGARLAELARSGGGAQRQRAAFATRQRLEDVVDALAVRTPGSAAGPD
jgi:carboxylate-amine ligase